MTTEKYQQIIDSFEPSGDFHFADTAAIARAAQAFKAEHPKQAAAIAANDTAAMVPMSIYFGLEVPDAYDAIRTGSVGGKPLSSYPTPVVTPPAPTAPPTPATPAQPAITREGLINRLAARGYGRDSAKALARVERPDLFIDVPRGARR
jgi:hypothetical protein